MLSVYLGPAPPPLPRLSPCSMLHSPEPVAHHHGSVGQHPQRRVVLLRHQLQIVGVLPFPLGAAVLEPDFYLARQGERQISLHFFLVCVCVGTHVCFHDAFLRANTAHIYPNYATLIL